MNASRNVQFWQQHATAWSIGFLSTVYKFLFLVIQGVLKKCTPFQIQIIHNLLNIRCSAVSWPILYLMQTWIMLNLNIFLWILYLFIQIEVILNSHVQKTLYFHAHFIFLRNYTAVKLLHYRWINLNLKGCTFFDTPCSKD